MTPAAVTSAAAFDLWASVYDQQPNPLLHLEQRFLKTLLPAVESLDVLDVGCGTGRWLQHFATQSPRTLIGVDASPAMLHYAAAKLGSIADLRRGECIALPVPSYNTDLLLASFVVSYLSDLEAFAFECSRVCRPDADLFLTDMHPSTQHACNWKRSFHHAGAHIHIDAQCHSLQSIVSAFWSCGFQTVAWFEPHFGLPEQEILRQHSKSEASPHLPPIYLLHLKKNSPQAKSLPSGSAIRLIGGRIAHGPHETTDASIEIREARIHSIFAPLSTPRCIKTAATEIDLGGHLILPGLINSHDHLEFALYLNLGHGPYINASQWADDIRSKDSAIIESHRAVLRDVRLWWGAIRNLLCGVTTVCHHNPVTPDLLDPAFPVRVVSNFGWSHSLALDPNLVNSFQSTPSDQPFILHAAEGIDDRSADEVFHLDRLNALDNRTILVHGLALTTKAVDLLNERNASVILCPSSNQFLFQTVPSSKIVAGLRNVALGSDSPLTATGDLLDEIRFAQTSLGITSNDLYEMVTTRAARILRLNGGEGRPTPGATADLIAVKDKGQDPAKTLANLHFSDVELVILSGRVHLASQIFMERLPKSLRQGLELIEVDGHLRWIRAPIQRLFAEAAHILGPDIRLGGKQVRNAGSI